jgi:hypothetical protein
VLSVALRMWLWRKDHNAVTCSYGVLRNAGGTSTSVPTVQASSPVIPAAVVGQRSRARSGCLWRVGWAGRLPQPVQGAAVISLGRRICVAGELPVPAASGAAVVTGARGT